VWERDGTPPAPSILDTSEDGLALEFTRRYRDELAYVHEWGKWLRWDGARWAPERTLAVYDLARTVTRDAAAPLGEREASRVLSASTVAAVVTLARTDRAHARVSEDFDADPWTLNTPAGTIDLRTCEMRPHRRADYLSKVAPIAPADAPSTLWLECLDTWSGGDAELVAFLQRLAGYFLTGSTREEVLPIIHGPGGNGKSQFVAAIRGCMGTDYAGGVAMETLIVTHGEQHPTDVADLRGKRLAVAVETEEGRRLAEAKVKQLTGGDRLRARYMRRDFFEFEPTHKLLVMGNHRPGLRNVDEAMRRRLLLIPFAATIPPGRRDRDLSGRLAAERPGILRWMLDGCLEWQRDGLQPPARVQAATDDYFAAADVLGRWAEDRLVFARSARAPKDAVYAAWKSWAEANGEDVATQAAVYEYLIARPDVDEARVRIEGKQQRCWVGVGLRSEA
jgi:putative DNA primase/helicase